MKLENNKKLDIDKKEQIKKFHELTSAEKNNSKASDITEELVTNEKNTAPDEVIDEDLEGYYAINDFTVGVRIKPGVKKNNETIETLFRGMKVYSDGTYVVVDGNTWLKVKSNGTDGYILKASVTKL